MNGKFNGITRADLLLEADRFGIRNPLKILGDVRAALDAFSQCASEAGLPPARVDLVVQDFCLL